MVKIPYTIKYEAEFSNEFYEGIKILLENDGLIQAVRLIKDRFRISLVEANELRKTIQGMDSKTVYSRPEAESNNQD